MESVWGNISSSFTQMLGWELVAVLLAIAYLLFALRESIWCWPAAFISTAIYTALFWNVSLLMDSALSVYYMGMAVFGWWSWAKGGKKHNGVKVHLWPLLWHFYAFVGIGIATYISGTILVKYTEAAWPYVDSFTTWASIFTTWLVVNKVLENWLYWIIIDLVSMLLYVDRGLYLTAVLFAAYVVICIFGYRSWSRQIEELDKGGNIA